MTFADTRATPTAGVGWAGGLKVAARVMSSTLRPMLAHVVVTRYCNLECAYCSEYDKVSKPVPLADLLERIDALARLGTQIVTLTGGEPLTHPGHDAIIRRIRSHGMVATAITNGFLLTQRRIEGMNAAGLQELQISIDGIKPDAVSKKTLKSLAGKLRLLSRHARFHVNINSVLGISEERTHDALDVARSAKALGFSHTVGVLHDADGALAPLSASQRRVYHALMAKGSWAHRINYWMFQKNLLAGKPNAWRCRAGARYLYICEDGLVHYCSQQRGSPGTPLLDYGHAQIEREYRTAKPCAPFCTVSCVHQASVLDAWRAPQRAA
ncbi:MAG: radical SAM protein [Caulobacteraceae bacterium]|nr:radical SAM protein [Caulobacteraceae bacterium]